MASENHENQIPEEEVLEREEKNSELPEEEVLKQEEERSELPEEEQKPATEEVSSTAQALETGRKRKPHDMDQFAKDYEEKNRIDTKASRRKWWIKTGLMLALIAVSIVLMFTITKYVGGGTQGFGKTFSNANWSWFAVVLAVLLLMMLAEILKYSYLLRISTGKWRLKNSAKVMFLGKYYDGITPLGTGGQPFQIYYLHKRNVPAGAATAVPLIRYFISTFVFCLMAVVLFIAAGFVVDLNSTVGTTAMVIAWISMIFNFAMPLVILFASLFPRAGKKFILRIINLLAKMHIVKRKYAHSHRAPLLRRGDLLCRPALHRGGVRCKYRADMEDPSRNRLPYDDLVLLLLPRAHARQQRRERGDDDPRLCDDHLRLGGGTRDRLDRAPLEIPHLLRLHPLGDRDQHLRDHPQRRARPPREKTTTSLKHTIGKGEANASPLFILFDSVERDDDGRRPSPVHGKIAITRARIGAQRARIHAQNALDLADIRGMGMPVERNGAVKLFRAGGEAGKPALHAVAVPVAAEDPHALRLDHRLIHSPAEVAVPRENKALLREFPRGEAHVARAVAEVHDKVVLGKEVPHAVYRAPTPVGIGDDDERFHNFSASARSALPL